MMMVNGLIKMPEAEWLRFQSMTFATWKPRTPDEFNAMIDLAIARHRADGGLGEMNAQSLLVMRFGPNGEMNFPEDKRRDAYAKVYGEWPTDDELADFENGDLPKRTGPILVVKNES